jgi:hypothetical protein
MRFLPLALVLLALTAACASTPETERKTFPRELAVGFLIVDGVYNTELTAPYDVFQHTIFHTNPGMRVFTVAPSLEPVRTFEGLRIVPDFTYQSAPPIDVLVVPSAEHSMDTDLETAIEIFTLVLARYHVPRNIVRAQTRVLRGEGYRMLRAPARGAEVSEAVMEALEAGTTDVFRIGHQGPAAGRSLRDLDLRHHTGATVLAVVRGETSHPNPSPETVLAVGDDLVLVGSHADIDRAFVHLAQGGSSDPGGPLSST